MSEVTGTKASRGRDRSRSWSKGVKIARKYYK